MLTPRVFATSSRNSVALPVAGEAMPAWGPRLPSQGIRQVVREPHYLRGFRNGKEFRLLHRKKVRSRPRRRLRMRVERPGGNGGTRS